jgi:hypothetical protein
MALRSKFKTDTVTVKRATYAISADGERVGSFADHLTGVKCSFQAKGGGPSISGGVDAVRGTHRLYCDVIDIREDDVIVYDSVDYRILFIDNNFNNHLQIDLEVRTNDN